MDSIQINGIRCYGYTGYLPEEQVLGQWFEVDLTLGLDLSVAGESDDIEDTVNYAIIVERVKHLVKTSKFALIERLAKAIASAVLELNTKPHQHPPIQQVKVKLIKVSPPIPDFGGYVSIELTVVNPQYAE